MTNREKTIRKFVNQVKFSSKIKDVRLLKRQLIANIVQQGLGACAFYEKPVTLDCLFDWSRTPEGFLYWMMLGKMVKFTPLKK